MCLVNQNGSTAFRMKRGVPGEDPAVCSPGGGCGDGGRERDRERERGLPSPGPLWAELGLQSPESLLWPYFSRVGSAGEFMVGPGK